MNDGIRKKWEDIQLGNVDGSAQHNFVLPSIRKNTSIKQQLSMLHFPLSVKIKGKVQASQKLPRKKHILLKEFKQIGSNLFFCSPSYKKRNSFNKNEFLRKKNQSVGSIQFIQVLDQLSNEKRSQKTIQINHHGIRMIPKRKRHRDFVVHDRDPIEQIFKRKGSQQCTDIYKNQRSITPINRFKDNIHKHVKLEKLVLSDQHKKQTNLDLTINQFAPWKTIPDQQDQQEQNKKSIFNTSP